MPASFDEPQCFVQHEFENIDSIRGIAGASSRLESSFDSAARVEVLKEGMIYLDNL